MKLSNAIWSIAICTVLLVGSVAVPGATLCEEEDAEMVGGLLGAPKEVTNAENSAEINELGQFAVTEYNTKEGKNLIFKKVATAKTQVVSGTLYHLTIEASHGEESTKVYEAKILHKPWTNHKSLEHFQPAEDSTSASSNTCEASGLRGVPVEDPVVKEAADQVIGGLNQRSNSLLPYELRHVINAKAEATDEKTSFELHLLVARGTKEEEVKAELHRTAEGKWNFQHSAPA